MRQPATHITELKSYLRCRFLWRVTAPPPRGLGLTPIVSKASLQQGRMVHEALQVGYDDPNIPFADAYEVIAARDMGVAREGSIFQSELEAMQGQIGMGVAMLKGYQTWAAEYDKNYTFLSMEQKWDNVKVGGIPFAGTFDAVVQRPDGIWILDFKTSKYTSADWTTQDLQATMYVHAARRLIGREVRGIIFRFLLKKVPQNYEKLILKNGSVTTRAGIFGSTNYREYSLALAVATLNEMWGVGAVTHEQLGLGIPGGPPMSLKTLAGVIQSPDLKDQPWFDEYVSQYKTARSMYYTQLQGLKGLNNFFWEKEEFRTETQINNYLKYVIYPAAKRMRSRRKNKWIGPTGLGASFTVCNGCQVKTPCEMFMRGAPGYMQVLRDEYQLNDRYLKEVKSDQGG